jgi:hypothetical protein
MIPKDTKIRSSSIQTVFYQLKKVAAAKFSWEILGLVDGK